jgi:hypothetical protein
VPFISTPPHAAIYRKVKVARQQVEAADAVPEAPMLLASRNIDERTQRCCPVHRYLSVALLLTAYADQ